jgi:hypothetical protein
MYEPRKHQFQLGKPNMYRVAVQALDLMSLDFEIHEFSRPRLTLAVLALIHLQESRLFSLYPCHSLA